MQTGGWNRGGGTEIWLGGAGVRGYEAWVKRMHAKVKNSLPSPPPPGSAALGLEGSSVKDLRYSSLSNEPSSAPVWWLHKVDNMQCNS